MKCVHCGCEWTLASGVSAPSKCPFCGEQLTRGDAPPSLATMEEALKYIAETYGAEILRDGQKLIAYFVDLVPRLRREQKLLRDFVQCNGNTQLMDVLPLSDAKKRQEWVRLTQYMENEMWINRDGVSLVCESFWNAASGGKIPAPVLAQTPVQAQPPVPVPSTTKRTPAKAQPQTPAQPTLSRTVGTIKIAGRTIRTDVTELDLRLCDNLTDLSPLSGLSQLKSLELHDCFKLTDLILQL